MTSYRYPQTIHEQQKRMLTSSFGLNSPLHRKGFTCFSQLSSALVRVEKIYQHGLIFPQLATSSSTIVTVNHLQDIALRYVLVTLAEESLNPLNLTCSHPFNHYRLKSHLVLITPAATRRLTLSRIPGFLMCSWSAAGSVLACWRMLCMTGSWRIRII